MKTLSSIPLLVGTLLLLLLSQPCYGHKVRIFAWEEGPDIVTESKFSGGKAARNVTVSVVDAVTGQQLLSGRTDDQGLFRFPLPHPQTSALEIIVDGGDGHKNSWKHVLDDRQPIDGAAPPATATSEPQGQQQPESGAGATAAAPLQTIDTARLAALIEETLEKKLAPIRRTLAENAEKGPGLQDILGGIGYIFGLAGIAAYMRFKKKDKE